MIQIALIPAYYPTPDLCGQCQKLTEQQVVCIVVNDGTPHEEQYEHIFSKLTTIQNVTVLTHEKNEGKGASIKDALRYIQRTYSLSEYAVVTMDADGQHSLDDALHCLALAQQNPNSLILGTRTFAEKDVPFKSKAGNFFSTLLFFIATRKKIRDTQTGLRAFTGELIPTLLQSNGERYEYETNALLDCVRNQVPIIQANIKTIYIGKNEASHFRPFADSFLVVKEFLKFSLSSFASFLIDYALYSLLVTLLSPTYVVVANVCARLVSGTFNFVTNSKLVFKQQKITVIAALKYILLAIAVLLLDTLLLVFFVQLGLNAYLAKIITELSLFIVSFSVQKLLIFNKSPQTKGR